MNKGLPIAPAGPGTSLGVVKGANDRLMSGDSQQLFDAFWREGELALLFGPPGVGKSILAVQIAEALAGGRPIHGFAMPVQRRRVLLVDLKLSDDQFARRYSVKRPDGSYRRFRHAHNLRTGRPDDPEELCEWLRATIIREHVSVVVIDDVSELRTTCDGTRETLRAMRGLRKLQRELGVSVLLLASSREPPRGALVSERDMMRSRVLCEAADSAFAIGLRQDHRPWRYVVQVRSRAGEIVWNREKQPACTIEQSEDGFLGFRFDCTFVPQMDDEQRRLVIDIKHRRDRKMTFRAIAEELAIPVSRVHRLLNLWTAPLEYGKCSPPEEPDATERRETVVIEPDDDDTDDQENEGEFDDDYTEAEYLAEIGLDEFIPFEHAGTHAATVRPGVTDT